MRTKFFNLVMSRLKENFPHVPLSGEMNRFLFSEDRYVDIQYTDKAPLHEFTIVINDQSDSFNEFVKNETICFQVTQSFEDIILAIKQKIENLLRDADQARNTFYKNMTLVTTYNFQGVIQSPMPPLIQELRKKDLSITAYGKVYLDMLAETLAKNEDDVSDYIQDHPYLDNWSAAHYYKFKKFAITKGEFAGINGHIISPAVCTQWANDIEKKLIEAKSLKKWHCDDTTINYHVYNRGWQHNILRPDDREEIIHNIEGFIAFLRRAAQYNQNVLQN